MYFVLILLLVVAILFASDRIRPDFIALSALAVLILKGTLTAGEALSGFGNTTVVLVALLFVIGRGLTQTGITEMLGDTISLQVRKGQENRLISMVMSCTALLSSFMSSTGVVALFVPVVQKIAQNNKFNVKRLLMPVAYGGLIGGMISLIATPPNLIVSEELSRQGYEPFTMLSFTPIGLVALIMGILYFFVLNKLKKREPREREAEQGEERMKALLEKYNIEGAVYRMRISKNSPYANKKVSEIDIRQSFDANILGVVIETRLSNSIASVGKETFLRKDDILYLHMDEENVERLCRERRLERLPYHGVHQGNLRQQLGLAEVIIPYNSNFIGLNFEALGKKIRQQINILGLSAVKIPTWDKLKRHNLREGDSMLILGSKQSISALRTMPHDMIVFNIPFVEKLKINRRKATTALVITLLMILFLVLNLVSPVLTVLFAVLALVGTRCLTMEDAYQSVSWSTVILIAAMIPFATALEKTGGINLIVDHVMGIFGTGGPYLLMTGLFIVTVLLSSFISNTATAVILAPIAIMLAEQSSISPHSLVMTLAIAASTAFLTPVASPVNMLVVSPGRYRFVDFLRTGLPMAMITLLICLLLVPLLFPF